MSLIHNERTKLVATTLNTLGIALIVAGIIAPTVAASYRLSEPMRWEGWWFLIGIAWLAVGGALHIGA
jgi:hypothetical protein